MEAELTSGDILRAKEENVRRLAKYVKVNPNQDIKGILRDFYILRIVKRNR